MFFINKNDRAYRKKGYSYQYELQSILTLIFSVFLFTGYLATSSYASTSPNKSAYSNNNYTLFEVDPVRPVVSLSHSGFVAALNIPDDYLELFKNTDSGIKHCHSIKVGMRPVALAVITESRSRAELWVVNHLSDSISVIKLNLNKCSGKLVNTIFVGDEPRDIVVANTPAGKRVFVTMAHRGQTHPDPLTRVGKDLVRTAAENKAQNRPEGLADIAIYNPKNPAKVNVITLFTDTPRALTLGTTDDFGYHNQVYAAGFHTGNQSTVIAAETARGVAVAHVQQLLAQGEVVESENGELLVTKKDIKMHGGTPAVLGKGRCMPDPRVELQRRHELQMCAQTDDSHNLIAFTPQQAGTITENCSCLNAFAEVQPVVSVMIKFYSTEEQCGEAFDQKIAGCWLDQDPDVNATSSPSMSWNEEVKFSLPDKDVFELKILADGSVELEESYSGVGTILFGMATHPQSGEVYVVNQDSNNLARFEGFGDFTGVPTVRGKISQSQISIIDKEGVSIKNLNDHLDHSSDTNAKKNTFAFPVAVEITAIKNERGGLRNDQHLIFAALGSDKLGYVSTSELKNAPPGELNQNINYLTLTKKDATGKPVIAGPVGISLDQKRNRLYVLARFTNELIVVETDREKPQIISRHTMFNPEPESVTAGRSVLYYATEMSDNGDQACASCHIFSNYDSLAWDLGNPDIASVNNPGPFISPPLGGFVSDLAIDPEQRDPSHAAVNPDARSNKGPMLTQALRGLANHGAMHWRGDRIRRVQNTFGENPDTGTLDEENSIREFDVAVTELTGKEEPLDEDKIDDLANFIMQIQYPPNPIRHLDNSLTPLEQAGRAAFFGCLSMTDEQFRNRVCIGTNGKIVKIDESTRQCECFGNPIRFVMHRLLDVQPFAKAFSELQLSIPENTKNDQQIIAKLESLFQQLQSDAQQIAGLQRRSLSDFAVAGNQAGYNNDAQVFDESQLQLIQKFVTGKDYPSKTNGLLEFIETAKAAEQQLNIDILSPLLAGLELNALPAELVSKLTDPTQISAQMIAWFGDSNVSRKPLLDALLPAGEEQNPLGGCKINITQQNCPLRIADSLTTCQGCHVLDEDANKEFEVEFPGFFGTSGEFAFSNIPQVFKVPHLRNLYNRVGKFGQPFEFDMFVGQSVFGSREGGFIDRNPPVVGPSVRAYGFSHDGSADTVHRFAGLLDFLKRPAGFLGANDVRGNPAAFDAFVPDDPSACLNSVAQGRDAFFNQLQADPVQMTQASVAAIGGDKAAAAQIVQAVLSSPAIQVDSRWHAVAASALEAVQHQQPITDNLAAPIVEAVASSLLCPNVPTPDLLPLCFQLGSTLESGSNNGICYPSGLKERDAAEAFALSFDTNLKPMVGQQVTLKRARRKGSIIAKKSFSRMLNASAAGHCDIGGWAKNRGYLLIEPNVLRPMESLLLSDKNKELTVAEVLNRNKRHALTFTCYPPKPDKSEARRSVLDRDSNGIPNGLDGV